ncbi:MAG TPA: hypothetical protein VGR84_16540, partial [Candidatus Acidoferrales bacterium]|nr:hypothetical protein [Candidatus Acidoferrales bacterium]
MPNRYGTTYSPTNHFARTACPAQVFPWILNRDCQVVAATVSAGLGAGRTLRHVIPSHLSKVGDVIENPEFVARTANEWLIVCVPLSLKLRWH